MIFLLDLYIGTYTKLIDLSQLLVILIIGVYLHTVNYCVSNVKPQTNCILNNLRVNSILNYMSVSKFILYNNM